MKEAFTNIFGICAAAFYIVGLLAAVVNWKSIKDYSTMELGLLAIFYMLASIASAILVVAFM